MSKVLTGITFAPNIQNLNGGVAAVYDARFSGGIGVQVITTRCAYLSYVSASCLVAI
jgi:hypothetical protein